MSGTLGNVLFIVLGHVMGIGLQSTLWLFDYDCGGNLLCLAGLWFARLVTLIFIGFCGNWSGWWPLDLVSDHKHWPWRDLGVPPRKFCPCCPKRKPCGPGVIAKCALVSCLAVVPAVWAVVKATLECVWRN